jgi:hypothetical protein
MKGGTGKTVTTYNLAYSLAKMGKKVLAVDFDSQANLTACFGVENAAELPMTIGHLMMDRIEDEELPETEEYIMNRLLFLEVIIILNGCKTYKDLMKLFGGKYEMPPESEYYKAVESVYRCPYIPDCPGNYQCFVLASPEPISGNVLVNINCKLCHEKIPIYAVCSDKVRKK